MFRSFFLDHLQGVLRCALCRYYSSRWFAFVEFVLLRSMWLHVYVICACFVFLSVGDLQAATYCVIVQTQRTQISGRNSNSTKHSGGPPEDGRKKMSSMLLFNVIYNYVVYYWPGPPCLPDKFVYVFVSVKWCINRSIFLYSLTESLVAPDPAAQSSITVICRQPQSGTHTVMFHYMEIYHLKSTEICLCSF